MKMIATFLSFCLLMQYGARGNVSDTVIITPSVINTAVLKTGEHRWLVYFKMGKDSSRSRYQFWTRKIDKTNYRGRDALVVTQEWENNDTIVHKVFSVCDPKSFAPLFHETWNKGNNSSQYDFLTREAMVNGKKISNTDPDSNQVKRYRAFEKSFDQYFLNWHLDLEVFPTLPYQMNRTFGINFYDPGFSAPVMVYYTVIGSGSLKGYDNQLVDCWLLEHQDNGRTKNHEIFYISKKTKEVLKLEQEFSGRYRYKIKMPFSS